jgi:hypothetical protein
MMISVVVLEMITVFVARDVMPSNIMPMVRKKNRWKGSLELTRFVWLEAGPLTATNGLGLL